MFTQDDCKPCSLAIKTEDSALRLLDDAIELVVSVLAVSSACNKDTFEHDTITRLPLTLRNDVLTLAKALQRRLLAYVTIIAEERRERQLCLPFYDEPPY